MRKEKGVGGLYKVRGHVLGGDLIGGMVFRGLLRGNYLSRGELAERKCPYGGRKRGKEKLYQPHKGG